MLSMSAASILLVDVNSFLWRKNFKTYANNFKPTKELKAKIHGAIAEIRLETSKIY